MFSKIIKFIRTRFKAIFISIVVLSILSAQGYIIYFQITTKQEVNNKLNDLTFSLENIKKNTDSISRITKDLSSLESDISSIESDVSSIQIDVSSIESDVSSLIY